jgi:hypothetical protein
VRAIGLFPFAGHTLAHEIRAFSRASTDNGERCYRSCAACSLRFTKKSWIIFAIKSRLSRNSPRAQDVASRFMLRTGNLGRNSPENLSHLQKERRKSRFDFRTSLFFPFVGFGARSRACDLKNAIELNLLEKRKMRADTLTGSFEREYYVVREKSVK